MIYKYLKHFGAAIGFLLISASAISQCLTCEPDYTCVADGFPILCPQSLPDGVTGEEYITTATFNMPSSVVDPGSGITATLESITISSVTGLPFGLELTPSNPSGVYYPSNGEDYGCATICGIPLSAGEYFVIINVDVVASAFGITQNLSESFSLPLSIIQGSTDGNASFATSTTSGCSPLTVDVTNNITGPGVSYQWGFDGYMNGTSLSFEILTDNYPAETTWMITDAFGTIVTSGGPYSEALTLYSETICVGPGTYTLSVNDSYGDGMQFEGVIGNYILTDSDGNILAEIIDGANFGAQGLHDFIVDANSSTDGCSVTSSNPSIIYDTPGSYTLSLTTTVTELTLTGLDITTLAGGWDGDVEEFFWGVPDPYFVLDGDVSYTSSWVGDTETPNFTGLSIPLNYGSSYSVSFYDDDDVSENDFLGTANFVASAPGSFTINGGGTTATITIEETISAEFFDSETISVFEGLDVWADMDGDGFGDLESPVNGCDPENITPYAFNSEDCNDNQAAIYPGALGTFEGIDNNCDEVVDGDEILAIEGCMDPAAANFNPNATVGDNSCVYTTCPGDFNFDGVITVNDLLILLSDFGCAEGCISDLNEDGQVSVADLLSILSIFGTICD